MKIRLEGTDKLNLVEEMNEYRVQCDKLRAKVESLRADKTRLDWLENQTGFQLDNARKKSKWACRKAATNYEYELFTTARSAIDAAMKGDAK